MNLIVKTHKDELLTTKQIALQQKDTRILKLLELRHLSMRFVTYTVHPRHLQSSIICLQDSQCHLSAETLSRMSLHYVSMSAISNSL